MPRFQSFKQAPGETRRTLRRRFARKLAVVSHHAAISPETPVTPDLLVFQLLDRLTISYSDEWATADAAYKAAHPTASEPPDLSAAVDRGWLRRVWGRARIPRDINIQVRRAPAGTMDAFKPLALDIYNRTYQADKSAPIESDLANLIDEITTGRSDPFRIVVRTPDWIAARLWETGRARASSDMAALRHWADLWELLHRPDFVPTRVWSDTDLQAFRDATLHLITSESTLGGWNATRDLYAKQAALAHGVAEDAVWRFPTPPDSLVGRALWIAQPTVEPYTYASFETCDDLFGLARLLLADADARDNAPAPYPIFSQILNLAEDRAELFIALLFQVRAKPRLLADLVLHPRGAALACLVIAQWPSAPGSAWDRNLTERDYRTGQSEAFEDAAAILGEHLRADQTDARETAALFAWLHRRAGSANIDDLAGTDMLMATLRRELAICPKPVLLAIAQSFDSSALNQGLDAPEFASVLDLADLGDLTSDLDADTLISAYANSLSAGGYTNFTHRIGVSGAAALARLSACTSALRQHFLYPIHVQAQLAGVTSDEKRYSLARDLGRVLRSHIRVLCRAIVGGPKEVPTDLVDALVAAVKTGAQEHKGKGRIAAFAAHFEKSVIGNSPDRPLANDLAAALGHVHGTSQTSLLAAILETDEPMVLAQLLSIAPPSLHGEIEKRITALAPDDAGTIRSLPEMQARIDELLTAGAADAAARYIEAERVLETLGKIPGREITQLQNRLRLAFLREDWATLATEIEDQPASPWAINSAWEIQAQFRGLVALRGPHPNPANAKAIFADMFNKHPSIGTVANWLAAAASELLQMDGFASLTGDQVRSGQQIIHEVDRMVASLPSEDKNEVLNNNRALLLLALGEPNQALDILSTVTSPNLQGNAAAYRAVALSRLGRWSEATVTLDEADRAFGNMPVLAAARSHIASGAPFLSVPAVSVHDDLVKNVGSAIARFKTMSPFDQAQALQRQEDPLAGLLIEHVRAAADALTSLVPMMKVTQIDGHEDDLNALLKQVLTARIHFFTWSAMADQSKGGYSANLNAGERDLVITWGNTTLAIIEALICDKPLTQDAMVANLESHFQKLLGYGNTKVLFHLTYAYTEDQAGVLAVLESAAKTAHPSGFTFLEQEPISQEDSRPPGFVARYTGDIGEIKVVFLVLNMGQHRQKRAAQTAGKTRTRKASKTARRVPSASRSSQLK